MTTTLGPGGREHLALTTLCLTPRLRDRDLGLSLSLAAPVNLTEVSATPGVSNLVFQKYLEIQLVRILFITW